VTLPYASVNLCCSSLVFRSQKPNFHEPTIPLRLLGIILRVLRLEDSVYNVYTTNQLQPTFARGGGGGRGGGKSVSRGV
jgi:hypothetical protein